MNRAGFRPEADVGVRRDRYYEADSEAGEPPSVLHTLRGPRRVQEQAAAQRVGSRAADEILDEELVPGRQSQPASVRRPVGEMAVAVVRAAGFKEVAAELRFRVADVSAAADAKDVP